MLPIDRRRQWWSALLLSTFQQMESVAGETQVLVMCHTRMCLPDYGGIASSIGDVMVVCSFLRPRRRSPSFWIWNGGSSMHGKLLDERTPTKKVASRTWLTRIPKLSAIRNGSPSMHERPSGTPTKKAWI